MNTTYKEKPKLLGGVGLLVVVLLASFLLSPLTAHAATTIKTLKTANQLVAGGASRGIDVSMWQGDVSWPQVAKDNVDFVFVRSSYGTSPDPYFIYNAQQAYGNGLNVGAYHYAHFRSTTSMEKEAEYFINQLRQVTISYPVVLDVENYYGLNKAQLTTLVLQFIEKVEAAGYQVMLYSYSNFFRDRLDTSRLGGTRLWVANYIEQPKGLSHAVWQHTSHGRVSGISGYVDINISYGGSAGKRVAAPSASPTPSPAPSTGQAHSSGLDRSSPVPKGGVPLSSSPSIDGLDKASPIPSSVPTPIAKKPEPTILSVDPTTSNLVKTFLNEQYNGSFSMQGSVKLSEIEQKIAFGLQQEAGLSATGTLTPTCATALAAMNYSSTQPSNATTLLQGKLLYSGFYKGELTGLMDNDTVSAIAEFQASKGMPATGELSQNTLVQLFEIG